jgi:putative transposase
VTTVAEAHPDRRVELWFMDEARVGQKGRPCHRWWLKGQRPPGVCDRRYDWAYIFAAVRPATGDDFALVLPEVSTEAMQTFLDGFAAHLTPNAHAVLVLDQAGWHGAKALRAPDNLTLLPLPPYSPELNPVERLWLYLRERFLSLRLFPDYDAILNACCQAWNALTAEEGRIASLCNYPWIRKVAS